MSGEPALDALVSLRKTRWEEAYGSAGAMLKEATAGVASLRLRIVWNARSAVAKGREQDNEVLELGDAIAVHIAVRRAPC